MRTLALVAVVVVSGCNAVLGLDPPGHAADAAIGDDAPEPDAPDAPVSDGAHDATDGAVIDAANDGPDAPTDAAIDGLPGCNLPTGLPDEDGDGYRDACDNCPIYGPAPMADDDGDGVGNACDAYPGLASRIVRFEGFNQPIFPPPDMSFHAEGPAQWTVSGGKLRLAGTTPAQHHYLARVDGSLSDVTIDALITIANPSPALPTSATRSVGVWAAIDTSSGPTHYPPGVVWELVEQTSSSGLITRFGRVLTTPVGASGQTNPDPELFDPGRAYRFRLQCTTSPARCVGTISTPEFGTDLTVTGATVRNGPVGLRWFGVDATVDYVLVSTSLLPS